MSAGTGLGIHRQFARARRLSVRFRQRIESLPVRATCRKEGLPLPSGHLIHKVAGTEDARWFLNSGRVAARWIEETLHLHGFALTQFRSILDFGCGVGRVLRHWNTLQGPQILGTDYNPLLINWCREHLDFADCRVNGLDQGLPYEDGSIDFAYSLSVFTHLSDELGRFWMSELRRILRPGGLLLFTTHGDCYRDGLNQAERDVYDAGRLVVQKASRQGTNDCAAYHPLDYVRAELAEGFDILHHRPEGALANPRQDDYLFRKQG